MFSGTKLDMDCMTSADACILFHKFQRASRGEFVDNYVSCCWLIFAPVRSMREPPSSLTWMSDLSAAFLMSSWLCCAKHISPTNESLDRFCEQTTVCRKSSRRRVGPFFDFYHYPELRNKFYLELLSRR